MAADTETAGTAALDRPSLLATLPRRSVVGTITFARRFPLGFFSAVLLVVVVLMAILAPVVVPADPNEVVLSERKLDPSGSHLLGTDYQGRDILSRLIYGGRVSLEIAILSVLLGTTVGAVWGVASAFIGGRFDMMSQRFLEVFMAFPALILALGIIAIKGPSIQNALFVIAVVLIPTTARVVRGTVLSLKQNPYVEASRALGASNYRVMFRHILPNAMAPVIVQASILLGATIIFEASLSFLGAGAKPTDPSWGAMISGNAGSGVNAIHDYEQFPWLAITPAILISLSVLSFNLLGDAVRDVLDPRLRGGGGRLR